MKISDIHTAKGLKFKLIYLDSSAYFSVGALIRIASTQKKNEFLVNQYGVGTNLAKTKPILCNTDSRSAKYILELFEIEKGGTGVCF